MQVQKGKKNSEQSGICLTAISSPPCTISLSDAYQADGVSMCIIFFIAYLNKVIS